MAAETVSVGAGSSDAAGRRRRRAVAPIRPPLATSHAWPTPGWPTPGSPTPGWPTPGWPTSGWPTSGWPTSGWPTSGWPTPGLFHGVAQRRRDQRTIFIRVRPTGRDRRSPGEHAALGGGRDSRRRELRNGCLGEREGWRWVLPARAPGPRRARPVRPSRHPHGRLTVNRRRTTASLSRDAGKPAVACCTGSLRVAATGERSSSGSDRMTARIARFSRPAAAVPRPRRWPPGRAVGRLHPFANVLFVDQPRKPVATTKNSTLRSRVASGFTRLVAVKRASTALT